MYIRGGQGSLDIDDNIPQVITAIAADVVLVLACPAMITLSTAESIHTTLVCTGLLLVNMDFEI